MNKVFISILILLLSISFLIGCNKEESRNKTYSEELKHFIYQNKTNPMYFNGFLDYGHSLIVVDEKEDDGNWISTSEITIDDLSGGESGANEDYFKQKVIQVVNKDSIVEVTEGNLKHNKSPYNNRVVLRTPLVKGNEWSQRFQLEDGNDYIAKTQIENVVGENGEREIMTVTQIEGKLFNKYPDRRYEERAIYKEGQGLIYFEHNYPTELEGFTFQYRYVDTD